MLPIKFPFKKGGFKHELIRRKGLVCLVKRSKINRFHFEVVRIRIAPEETSFGKLYPEREVYPPSEDWGTHGFTINDENRAHKAFDEMVAEELQKQRELAYVI